MGGISHLSKRNSHFSLFSTFLYLDFIWSALRVLLASPLLLPVMFATSADKHNTISSLSALGIQQAGSADETSWPETILLSGLPNYSIILALSIREYHVIGTGGFNDSAGFNHTTWCFSRHCNHCGGQIGDHWGGYRSGTRNFQCETEFFLQKIEIQLEST